MIRESAYIESNGHKSAITTAVVNTVDVRVRRGANSLVHLTDERTTYRAANNTTKAKRVVIEVPSVAVAADILVTNDSGYVAFDAAVRETMEEADNLETENMAAFSAREQRLILPRDRYSYDSALVIMLPTKSTLTITWLRELNL